MNGRRQLLFLTPTFTYPPQSGGDIRLFELVKRLTANYEIHLLSLSGGSHQEFLRASGAAVSHAFESVWQSCLSARIMRKINAWKGAPHGISLEVDPSYAQRVREVIRSAKYEGVLIEHLYMFQYAKFCAPLPVLFSAYDVESLKYSRWYGGESFGLMQRLRIFYQKRALRRLESGVGLRARVVVATSENDRDALQKMNKKGRFVVVPNGADLDYFAQRPLASFGGSPAIVFVGSLFYKPNLDCVVALKKVIMPLVRSQIPEAICHVVGNCGSGNFSDLHDPENGMVLHQTVRDIRPYLLQCQVLAVPLKIGSGTRIKILEAMASGTPVVSTAIGAEGIRYTHGTDIIIADGEKQMGMAIIALLKDRDRCTRIGAAGRVLVERLYTWDAAASILSKEINDMIGSIER